MVGGMHFLFFRLLAWFTVLSETQFSVSALVHLEK